MIFVSKLWYRLSLEAVSSNRLRGTSPLFLNIVLAALCAFELVTELLHPANFLRVTSILDECVGLGWEIELTITVMRDCANNKSPVRRNDAIGLVDKHVSFPKLQVLDALLLRGSRSLFVIFGWLWAGVTCSTSSMLAVLCMLLVGAAVILLWLRLLGRSFLRGLSLVLGFRLRLLVFLCSLLRSLGLCLLGSGSAPTATSSAFLEIGVKVVILH